MESVLTIVGWIALLCVICVVVLGLASAIGTFMLVCGMDEYFVGY